MKLRIRTIILFLLILYIGFECEFNYMINMGPLSDREISILVKFAVCILTFLIYKCCKRQSEVSRDIKWIERLFVIIFLINVFVSIFSEQTFLDSFLNAAHYSAVLLIEPVIYVLEDKKDRKKTILFLISFSVITLCMRAYMAFYYHYHNHELLFPMLTVSTGEKVRYSSFFSYDMLRVFPSCYGNVIAIAFAYFMLSAKKLGNRILSGCLMTLVLAYYIFMYQTRSYVVILGIEIFLMFLARKYNRNGSIKQLFKYIFAFVIVIVVFNTSYVQNLISSFSVHSEYGQSTSIRLMGLAYVLYKFVSTIPFGIGGNGAFDSVMGLVYLDDYGFLDFLVRNSIWGLAIYIILIVYMFKSSRKCKNGYYNLIMLGCVLVIVSGMLAVDNFLPRKIGAIPFVIGLFEWARLKYLRE